MEKSFYIPAEKKNEFILRALHWATNFKFFTYFNPNNYTFPHSAFEHKLLIGNSELDFNTKQNPFEKLNEHVLGGAYLSGHLSYDLKNRIENLKSENAQYIDTPELQFFEAVTIIHFSEEAILIESEIDPEQIFEQINECQITTNEEETVVNFKQLVSKEEYIKTVNKLIDHIIEGDIYEINYCIPFVSDDFHIEPIKTFIQLCNKYPAPFSVLYKMEDQYVISGSPERYLKKEGRKLISQPIKGTSKRGKDAIEDQKLISDLRSNEKELAENMMIVDLVRNDLARSCKPGTVNVEEMFGVYTFPLWHQMISTVTGDMKENVTNIASITNSFPMGSMTGAPKIKVMELAEKYEISKRGIYSGAIGYFKPNGDFDFNVVIRSLVYDEKTKICTFNVGSAITYDSDPESEFNECLLKAKTLTSLFK